MDWIDFTWGDQFASSIAQINDHRQGGFVQSESSTDEQEWRISTDGYVWLNEASSVINVM